jgi:hypothetical protein
MNKKILSALEHNKKKIWNVSQTSLYFRIVILVMFKILLEQSMICSTLTFQGKG